MQPFWSSTAVSFGVSKRYLPRPDLIYTTTFASAWLRPVTTMGGITGDGFAFTQVGSALISMGRKTGGSPSNFTVPVIDPEVDASTTAVGGGGSEDSLDFLLQPMMA